MQRNETSFIEHLIELIQQLPLEQKIHASTKDRPALSISKYYPRSSSFL